jgi:hypothetical protein
MAGYTMMNDEELCLNTYTKEDKCGKYIMSKGEGMTEDTKLYLEDEPIAPQPEIVGRVNHLLLNEETRCERLGVRHQVHLAMGQDASRREAVAAC